MPARIKNIFIYTFLSSASWEMYKVIYNLYIKASGLSNEVISSFTSLELWGSAIIGLLLGILGDRFGRKKMLIGASLTSGLLAMSRVFIIDPKFLIIIAFILGGTFASRMILLNSYIVQLTDHGNRGKAFGLNFGIMMGSGLFGNMFGGYLGDLLGLKSTLLIASLIYLSSNIMLINIKDGHIKNTQTFKQLFDFRGFSSIEKRVTTGYLMSTAFVGFGAGLFIHFGNIIFKDLFDMSPTSIGIALSIAQVGTAMGSFLSPKLGKKYGPVQYTLLCQLAVIPLIVSLAYVRNPIIFIVIYALRFTFMNMTNPVITTLVMSNLPDDKITTINSLNNFLNNSVRGVATAMFGFIVGSSISGYKTIFLISSIFYLLNFIVFLVIYYPLRNDKKTLILYKREG